jgi:predicted RNase H-like HicB family nuclease
MDTKNELLNKSIAFGEVVISAEDMEVTIDTLYTIEDDAYYYIYCPQIGTFAYGNDIKSAEDNIVSAISANYVSFHAEGRITDLYSNPLSNDYVLAIEELKRNHSQKIIKVIAEYHLNRENTENIPTPKKGAQLYNLTNEIKMKVYSERVTTRASA